MSQRPVNKARGSKLGRALEAAGYEGRTDWGATITDTLADLRHLADTHGLDFGQLDRVAYDHYLAELHSADAEAQDTEARFTRTGKL